MLHAHGRPHPLLAIHSLAVPITLMPVQYFSGDAFCHGLLFTALSRVRGDWARMAVMVGNRSPELLNCVQQHVVGFMAGSHAQ